MKPICSKLTLLLLALGVGLVAPDNLGAASPRKKPKTTKTTKSKSSSTSKKKTKAGSSKRTSRNSRSRHRSRRVYVPTAEQLEQMRQDSIRLRTGGSEPIQKVSDPTARPLELLTTRFRRADSTLTRSEVHELYFAVDGRPDTAPFLSKIEEQADALINEHKFADALKVVQQGLWRTPTHIGLIKRACDLSLHLKSNRFESYMYQLVELLSMLAHTGDASSREKAIEVRSTSDALLFEVHWNETAREDITSTREESTTGKNYFIVTIRGKDKGKSEDHYYLLRSTFTTDPTSSKK